MPLNSCSATKSFGEYEKFCIIQATESPANEHWAHYLYTHFSHRCELPELVTEQNAPGSNTLVVKVCLDSTLGKTYKIDVIHDEMQLSAGNKEVMLWLCYQFISKVAESDNRFRANDLPPAAIDMQNIIGEFPFEFRGISSPNNANEDLLGVTASHNVDYNWALWGHNLRKVVKLSGSSANPDIYAKVNGQKDTTQYCFSSKALYKIIENYIVDQWGEGEQGAPERFTIMPMDNRKVCTCHLCTAAGNTPTNATPAVTKMIEKVAKRFPKQQFFTSAYITTQQRPTHRLPDNVGVLISAMDLPMVYDFRQTNEFTDFDNSIKAWLKLTPNIYIWDYMRNFDDYLTPYPCLQIMQQRILYYKDLGVKGIFVNGSEEKFSTFDDMQTATLQALLSNPELDVKQYTETYLRRFYHKTAATIAEYYTRLEDKVKNENICLPYYGGIEEELQYIDPREFNEFRMTLDKQAKQTTGDERMRLNKMLTALSFTPLETMRLKDNPVSLEKATELLEILSGYESFKDMAESKEALGSLETYIEQWNDDAQNAPRDNLLIHQPLTINNPLNEDSDAAAKLTDGKLGFYSDYHTCWVVSKAEWQINIPATQATTLKLSLLVAPAWRIWEPQQIELSQADKVLATWTGRDAPTDKTLLRRSFVELSLAEADKNKPLTLKMKPVSNRERATIACDEIMAF